MQDSFFTPLQAVRRNLLIASSLSILVGFLSVDVTEFAFLGVKFDETTLKIALLAVTGFYLIGYSIKAVLIWRWIQSDEWYRTIGDSNHERHKVRAKEFNLLASAEVGIPVVLGVIGMFGLIH